MAESSTLKLIMENGPRAGETLEYTSSSIVKIGRVVRGNTISIKDAGISSKHIRIEFDHKLNERTLFDLDSSNGTFLNGEIVKPDLPSGLKDGDYIKIGELTSIIVKIGVQSERNLGESVVMQPVEKRVLRPRAKKANKAVVVNFFPIEPKKTRCRSKRLLGTVQSSGMEVKLDNNVNKSVPDDEGNQATSGISPVENVEKSGLEKNLNTNNESTQDRMAEKLMLKQEDDCDGSVKNTGIDNGRWLDLEKMTLGDFFDYLEVQLPKEIIEKTEKIIADLEEKTRKCHEFKLQTSKKLKG